MKEKKIIIGLIIFNLITISIIFNLLVNRTINSEKQIIKKMSATEYENNITALNSTHTEYANYIESCKNKIAQALTQEGINISSNSTLEVMSDNISKIFETRTRNATATADNILQGKTAYVAGQLITGTAKSPEEQYNQGFVDGQSNAISNLKVQYTYHTHTGNSTQGGGCYSSPIYHQHSSSCNRTCTRTHSYNYIGTYEGTIHAREYIYHSSCGQSREDLGVRYPASTNSWTDTHQYIGCGISTSAVQGYSLACGKTEQTVESATIIY